MRIVLTGANGQFGTEFLQSSPSHHEVVALSHAQLDIADRDAVLQCVHALLPDVIVHAGAWTNVDGCESDPAKAFLVNALGTRNVAEAAASCDAHVLYLSSDYVFAGQPGGPTGNVAGRGYTEWDQPNPQSEYGRSKLGGEQELRSLLGERSTIVRTSWVMGSHGNNFMKTMVRVANDPSISPTVVNDQIGSPTFTADLAAVVREFVVRRVPGVFHVSNNGRASWFDVARAVFVQAGHDGERVKPVTTAEYMAGRAVVTAPRPYFSVLEHVALDAAQIRVPEWTTSLNHAMTALRNQ